MELDGYESVGRFIYGYHRVKSSFDSFCQSLEESSAPANGDMPVRELADRAESRLADRYGTESLLLAEFVGVANIMREGEDRLNDIRALLQSALPPSDAETGRLLQCQARLDHIRQLMSAA